RHLAAHPQDRHLHHAQPARGPLAVDPRRGDDGEARTDQGGARAADGASALDGGARDGGAPRQALERDPRGIAEGHAVKVALLRLGLLAAVLAVWELVGRAANPLLAVPPSAVLPALRDLLLLRSYPELPASLWLTVREIVTAYALAAPAGPGRGLALGMHRLAGRTWGPMLAALYAVPAVVWYPSLMLFFGLDA